MRGANVIMPNLTPPQYRVLYEIYPDKACIGETADAVPRAASTPGSRTSAGKSGSGRGDSPGYQRRHCSPMQDAPNEIDDHE